jgi:hypothetical protein
LLSTFTQRTIVPAETVTESGSYLVLRIDIVSVLTEVCVVVATVAGTVVTVVFVIVGGRVDRVTGVDAGLDEDWEHPAQIPKITRKNTRR